LVEILSERRLPPARSVAITFDDGYASNIEIAAPELEAMGLPWSAFLPAGLIETGGRQWLDDLHVLLHRGGRREFSFHLGAERLDFDLSTPQARTDAVQSIIQRCRYLPQPVQAPAIAEIFAQFSSDQLLSLRQRYLEFAPMTWDQARQLRASGVEVGNHSLSHLALAVQDAETIRHQVLAAEDLFKQRLGAPSPHFSYPYGSRLSYSDQTATILREAGCRCALTLVHELVRCPLDDLMCLPRLIVPAQPGRTLTTLWQRFSG
jgi:peptidoglycan/xylan/chitin deacetylase (PgdA/CDA1 family)